MNTQDFYELNRELRRLAFIHKKTFVALKDKQGKIIKRSIAGQIIGGKLPFEEYQKYIDYQLIAWAFPVISGYNKMNPGSGRVYRDQNDWRKDYEKSMPDMQKIQDRLSQKSPIKKEV